jgi:hypothetical protein
VAKPDENSAELGGRAAGGMAAAAHNSPLV